jgi:hypothetical protein
MCLYGLQEVVASLQGAKAEAWAAMTGASHCCTLAAAAGGLVILIRNVC